MSCKYFQQGACGCQTDCLADDDDELDAQMIASVVILVLVIVGFVIWSLV